MSVPLRVLMVEDSPDDAELVLRTLSRGGYRPTSKRVETADGMVSELESRTWDVILADYSMPRFGALPALVILKERRSDLPCIVVSGAISDETAVICMKAGAHDYVLKDNLVRLVPAIQRELGDAETRRRRYQLEQTLRLTTEELRIAGAIQQKLYPAAAPRLAGFDIAGSAYPAQEACGDYFDFFPMTCGSLGIAIGDVSGHGVGPALLMAQTRACLRSMAFADRGVADILDAANRILFDSFPEGRFITLFLAELNPRTKSLVYSGAGHQGYVLDGSGRLKTELKSTGLPLGICPEIDFPAAPPVLLEPNDIVLLFTDGIDEAETPDETPFGLQRTLSIVRAYRHLPAKMIVSNLYHAVRAFTHNRPQRDDIATVIVKVGNN